jgi:predicted nuclease of predicted toxin-antitoxin system
MNFKIDENLPVEVAGRLQAAGYDAQTVLMQGMGGETDSVLAEVCQREGRALVTLDLDFADLRAYPPADYPGIIVLRLPRQDKDTVLVVVERLLQALEQEPLAGHLWIVEEHRLRMRGGLDAVP